MKKIWIILGIIFLLGFASSVVFASGEKEAKAGEPKVVEIEFLRGEHPQYPHNPNAAVWDVLAEKTGVRVKLKSNPWSGWQDKLTTLLASNNMPEMTSHWNMDIIRPFVDSGMFMESGKYMHLMPEYEKWLKTFEEGGNDRRVLYFGSPPRLIAFHRFNRHQDVHGHFPALRTDLMEKHNIAIPKTFDELYTVLKEFKQLSPHNYPWGRRKALISMLLEQLYMFGTGPKIYYDWDEKKWLYGPLMPEYKKAIQWYAKVYQDGLIDPDTNTNQQYVEKMVAEKFYFWWDDIENILDFNANLRQVNPEAKFEAIPILPDSTGRKRILSEPYHKVQYIKLVSSKYKYQERMAGFFNYLYSEEGVRLMNFGVEGKNFTWESGEPKMRPEVYAEYRKKNMPYRTFLGDHAVSQNTLCVVNDHRNYLPWAPAINKKSYTYINGAVDAKIIREPRWPPPFAGEEGERRVDIEASLNNILDPTLEALIIGNKDFSEWDNLVKALKKAGAEDLERMYNESQARMESVSK